MWLTVSTAVKPIVAVTLWVRYPAQRGRLEFSECFSRQLACMAPILRRLSAMQTSLNSACAFFNLHA